MDARERAVTRTPRCSQGSPAPAAMHQPPRSLAGGAASDPTAWGARHGVNQTVGSGDLVLINHRPAVHTTAPKHSLQPPRVPGDFLSLPGCRTVRFDRSSRSR